MQIEVVYALPDRQALIRLELPAGATVAEAVAASGLAERFPQAAIETCRTGIWGKIVERDHLLADGDRVELYRPLEIDPREARRRLAEKGRSMGAPARGKSDDSR